MKTISDKEYAELLQAKAERDTLKAENQELHTMQERSRRLNIKMALEREEATKERNVFAQLCWWMAGLVVDGVQKVGELKSKLFRDEHLMSNGNLKPEQRAYLYAAAPALAATRRQDEEGRGYLNNEDIMQRSGLPKSTFYRVRKELKKAKILDARTYTRQTSKGMKMDHFEKLDPLVYSHPEGLDAQAPKNGGYHPRCEGCEGDDTAIERKTVETITCLECGEKTTAILPTMLHLNPRYHKKATIKCSAQETSRSLILRLQEIGEVSSA